MFSVATLRDRTQQRAGAANLESDITTSTHRRVALLGSHLPRQCGIATFTSDLADALEAPEHDLDCSVVAMSEAGKLYRYPDRIRFEISEAETASYRRAADFLNVHAMDVVSLQHEYGIFGGKSGSLVLGLLRELRMPIVTTLHTVLAEPTPWQRVVMDEILQRSTRVVVMGQHTSELLQRAHRVGADKIDIIPHGIDHIEIDGDRKELLGVKGSSVILTFGLLSPDKGIEHVIDALPSILERFPNTVYIVLGATHPHVKERHGETYRLMLENRAMRLGVQSNVLFHDRFVTKQELREFIGAADVYITPYLKREQTSSGTLALALGSGKAVVSTPYRYAEELLADGRGVLVPWKDPAAIASAITGLLSDEGARLALCRRGAEFGKTTIWPVVAQQYTQSFARAIHEYDKVRCVGALPRVQPSQTVVLPEIKLNHLRAMSDATGLLQHANYDVPCYEQGYCLDDNARALLLTILLEDCGAEPVTQIRSLTTRYLAFVSYAFDPVLSRFRNQMSYSRRWTEDCGSEDSHARALWALGAMVGRSFDPGRQSLGGQLFHAALPAVLRFTSPRAWAITLLGIGEYLRAFRGDRQTQSIQTTLAQRLVALYRDTSSPGWKWFESSVTYSNARLPQALILVGHDSNDDEMTSIGLESLRWLAAEQLSPNGHFSPIGSNGFWQRGTVKPLFDQQPLEACSMVSACLEAWRVTEEALWLDEARRAFNWFLGDNHLAESLYDDATGGCRDGLHAQRVNQNQGAESTLAFLLALLEMRATERPLVVQT